MKIIIIIEKYGGFCNRLFQSLHYSAFSIENNIYFFNPSMLGLLRFDNKFYYFWDKVNNFFLSILSKFIKYLTAKDQICFYFNKNNYIKIVNGWEFRENKLTERHHEKLKQIYSFEKKNFSNKINYLINYLDNLKKKGRYIIGLHIRRNDYKFWNDGKFYFSDQYYEFVIKKLRINFNKINKNPFIVVVSDEKVSSKIGFDFISNGSWKEDQIVLQNCDILVGPPSTFSMWASYISQIPIIELTSEEKKDFVKGEACKG
tara:strand:- start:569 stop:1345 length:777 start_codon:yes stop_codon:yes gene_type:complete